MDLHILGLGEDEVDALHALAHSTALHVEEVARQVGRPVRHALGVLGRLEERGLVGRAEEDPHRFELARPSVALGAELSRTEADLRAAEVVVSRLERAYDAVQRRREPAGVVDLVRGRDAVADCFGQLQENARTEVLSLVKAPVAALHRSQNPAEDAALARGVGYRVVLERAMLEAEPGLYAEVGRMRELGERVRIAVELPVKLLVVDREHALAPLSPAGAEGDSALLVRRSGLLDALVALFELVWVRSVEAVPEAPAPPGLSDGDRRVLRLILAGMTDEAVASQLQMSARTVQRRLRAMMLLTGAESRVQLGYAAASRGWV